MASKKIIFTLTSICLLILNFSCGSGATESELTELKYFKNLNASMISPVGFRQIEGAANYTFFNDPEDKMYVFSIYNQQTSEQVKQLITSGMKNGGFSIEKKGDFTTIENGVIAVDVIVTTPQTKADGFLLLKEVTSRGTLTYFTCAMDMQSLEIQKENLKKIAASTVIGQKTGVTTNDVVKTNSGNLSPKGYQDLLDDKVLISSNYDRSNTTVEDNTQSHGVSTYYQDVEKVHRFVFCSKGYAYYRYMSIGDQMSGDYGVAEYEKFSGHWKIAYENGQCYVFMQDERDNRTRSWLINGVQGDRISIDGVSYRMYPDIKSKGECQGKYFVVPGE